MVFGVVGLDGGEFCLIWRLRGCLSWVGFVISNLVFDLFSVVCL